MSEHSTVAVVGAGTMGAGIALVALQAGFWTTLFDIDADALRRAQAEITRRTAREAQKGQLTETEAARRLDRLSLVTELADLADADLVVEAAPERMQLKQQVFRDLDQVCKADAVLATNTSSLSVSAIAAVTRRPGRVVGLHFFNPAPVMRLIEVVVGEATEPATVEEAVRFVRSFAKEPAVCRDTPGFIVNRVARNFYGEALRVVGEGTAAMADVDRLMHANAGFPLGPFALMDMIGIDVNFDVTCSVYDACFGEPRYRPHRLQALRVATGQLGRKSGRGFYEYRGTGQAAEAVPSTGNGAPKPHPGATVDLAHSAVIGDTALARALRARIAAASGRSEAEAGLVFAGPLFAWQQAAISERAEQAAAFVRERRPQVVWIDCAAEPAVLRPLLQAVEEGVGADTLLHVSIAGPSATEQASWLSRPARVRGFCSALPLPAANPAGAAGEAGESDRDGAVMAWSRPLQAQTSPDGAALDERSQGALTALGFNPIEVRDGAGGVVMRILAMVLNEAAEALREGIAQADDLDTAMRLGTGYPHGPVAWLRELGTASVWNTLCACWRELGDDRYRPSPLLRQWWLAGAATGRR